MNESRSCSDCEAGAAVNLEPDFKEFIELLNSNRVEYLLIGGYAVAAHGHPRYTKDIDVWIAATDQNAKKVIRVLEQFGFADLGLTPADFTEPNQIVQLGYEPVRIDVLTGVGLPFEVCYPKRVLTYMDGVEISVVALDDLIALKRIAARPQDLADIDHLS